MKPASLDREKLHAIVVDFYDRVFDDIMIGFMFKGKDKGRLIEKELELTLSVLGEPVAYTGKPVRQAHSALRIFRGHFGRRLQILRETLRDHALEKSVSERWIAHSESLRGLLLEGQAGECGDPGHLGTGTGSRRKGNP